MTSASSSSRADFTLISSTGEEHRLPLAVAEHCITLAWLIPSGTLSCILSPSCTDASIRLVLRLLPLLSQHPFPSAYDGEPQPAVPAVYLDAVAGLGRSEVQGCADVCAVLRVHPLQLTRLWRARDEALSEEARAAGRSDQAAPTTQPPLLDIALPASPARPTATSGTDEATFTFTVTSTSGTAHSVPASLASLVPAARATMAAGSFSLALSHCTDDTLQLVLDFLRCLTLAPLLVGRDRAFTAGSASNLSPAHYSALLDGRLRWNDGSTSAVITACRELQLQTLLEAVMTKTAEMMTTMMATQEGREAMLASFKGLPPNAVLQVQAVPAAVGSAV